MRHKLPFNTSRSKLLNEVSRRVTFAFPAPFSRHRDFFPPPGVCPNLSAILLIFSGVTDQEASALPPPLLLGWAGLAAAVVVRRSPALDGHTV